SARRLGSVEYGDLGSARGHAVDCLGGSLRDRLALPPTRPRDAIPLCASLVRRPADCGWRGRFGLDGGPPWPAPARLDRAAALGARLGSPELPVRRAGPSLSEDLLDTCAGVRRLRRCFNAHAAAGQTAARRCSR